MLVVWILAVGDPEFYADDWNGTDDSGEWFDDTSAYDPAYDPAYDFGLDDTTGLDDILDSTTDSDEDGIPDEEEVNGFEVMVTYTDTFTETIYDDASGESWDEVIEYEYTTFEIVYTDPNNPDSDFDLLPDGYERDIGYHPKDSSDGNFDFDHDQLTFGEEYLLGTDPANPNSDGDDYDDWVEAHVIMTDPMNRDDPDDSSSTETQTGGTTGTTGTDSTGGSDSTVTTEDGPAETNPQQDGTMTTTEDASVDGSTGEVTGTTGEETAVATPPPVEFTPELAWRRYYGIADDDRTTMTIDTDGDGLIGSEEFALGTSPHLLDSDRDGIDDGAEVEGQAVATHAYSIEAAEDNYVYETFSYTDPESGETYTWEEAVQNIPEMPVFTSDPLSKDGDGDLYGDAWEWQYHANPLNPVDLISASGSSELPEDFAHQNPISPFGDEDGDGLLNAEEFQHRTDPFSDDTDNDGLADADEINGISDGTEEGYFEPTTFEEYDESTGSYFTYETEIWVTTGGGELIQTNPTTADTDGDLLPDLFEIDAGLNPNNPGDGNGIDADGDNLSLGLEYWLGTSDDEANGDQDDDGLSDHAELVVLTPILEAMGLIPFDPRNPIDGAADYDGDGMSNAEEFALNRDLFFVETDPPGGGETPSGPVTTGGNGPTGQTGTTSGTGTAGGNGPTVGTGTTGTTGGATSAGTTGTSGGATSAGGSSGGTSGGGSTTAIPPVPPDDDGTVIWLESRKVFASYKAWGASDEETIEDVHVEVTPGYFELDTGEWVPEHFEYSTTTEVIPAIEAGGSGLEKWREYGEEIKLPNDSISSVADGVAYVADSQIPNTTEWQRGTFPEMAPTMGARFKSQLAEEDDEAGSGNGTKVEFRISLRDANGNLVNSPNGETKTLETFRKHSGESGKFESGPPITLTIPPGKAVSVEENEAPVTENMLVPDTGPQLESTATLLPVDLKVDYDRDGEDDILGDPGDTVPDGEFYRFWINNDQDSSASGHEYEDEGEVVPPTRLDCNDSWIKGRRDLEDFTRLHVHLGGMHEAVRNGEIRVGLKWQDTGGTSPKINVFRAADESAGSLDYLVDDAAATSQVQGNLVSGINEKYSKKLVTVSGTTATLLPVDAWSNLSSNQSDLFLLFEGCVAGRGRLVVTFHKSDGTEIGEGANVSLELLDIKKMYNRGGHRNGVVLPDLFDSKPSDETDDTIIFVHGWRMSPEYRDNFAETFYKRLWYRGFMGRFASFQWDTYHSDALGGGAIAAYLSKYNDSEQIGWQSAENLKFFISTLPGARKHLAAHSMGNIVASEALRLGANVENYALMQAAVPSAAYDEHVRTKFAGSPYKHMGIDMWDKETPDDDTDPATRDLAYRGRFKDIGNSTNLISFYLPPDYATFFPWEFNNDQSKPEGGILAKPYRYIRSNPAGQKLYRYRWHVDDDYSPAYQVVDYYLSAQKEYEAMAHVCSTWGKAQGAQNIAQGAVRNNVNLSDPTFTLPGEDDPGFGDEHSGQFNSRIQHLKTFYDRLLDELIIPRNP